MVSTKVRIMQTVEQMDDATALSVWDMLTRHFNVPHKQISWDDIEEVEPDEIDIQMMREMESDPDCKIFVSRDEMIARRNARK